MRYQQLVVAALIYTNLLYICCAADPDIAYNLSTPESTMDALFFAHKTCNTDVIKRIHIGTNFPMPICKEGAYRILSKTHADIVKNSGERNSVLIEAEIKYKGHEEPIHAHYELRRVDRRWLIAEYGINEEEYEMPVNPNTIMKGVDEHFRDQSGQKD